MSLFRVTNTMLGTYIMGQGVNRMWFNVAGGTAAQAATAAGNWWNGVKDLIDDGTVITKSTEVPEVDEATGDIISMNVVSATSVTGTASEDPMSPLCQACVTWHTGHYIAGKEVRGRTFIPSLTEGDWNSGAWATTREALVVTANAALVSDANSIFVIYSPTHGAMWPVTHGVLSPRMSYLRSRRT